jgi:hypothetical protein
VVPALRAAFGDEDAEDPHYAASFTVLAECVKHHVKEEEGDMFPEAKKAKLDLDDLGAQMRARKADGRSRRRRRCGLSLPGGAQLMRPRAPAYCSAARRE